MLGALITITLNVAEPIMGIYRYHKRDLLMLRLVSRLTSSYLISIVSVQLAYPWYGAAAWHGHAAKTRSRRDLEVRQSAAVSYFFVHTHLIKAMHVREEALLEARKSSLQNPDDWPTFHISNICVTSQNTGKKVSLLSAHVNNAVCVSGKLEEIEDGFLNLGALNAVLLVGRFD